MKFIYIFFFSILFNVVAAQDVRQTAIFEEFNSASLTKVIRTLKNKYKIKFAYDDALISGVIVDGSYNNVIITDFLDDILPSNGIDYQILNGKFILIPKAIDRDPSAPTLFNFTLSGTVRDRLTGETLPNAVVRVAGSSYATVTNKDGRFMLPSVPTDTSTIQISYLGYKVNSTKLDPDETRDGVSVDMREQTTNIRGVTVESSPPSETIKTGEDVGQLSINPRNLSNVPSLGELDVFRSLQLLPGITGTDETSGGLSIRGSDPSQNLVTFDDFSIYRLDHFFGIYSAINADAVKDIQIFKSGFSPKYGGRVAGVVDITGKSGSRVKPEFTVGANMLSARFSAQAPLFNKKGSFILTGRRAYTDIIQSNLYRKLIQRARENSSEIEGLDFVNPNNQDEVLPDFHFYDINAKIAYNPTENERLTFTFYKGNDNLMTESERENENGNVRDLFTETADWGNEGYGFSWSKQWNRQYYSRVSLGRSKFFEDYFYDYQFDADDGGRNERFDLFISKDNNIQETQLSLENEVYVNEKNRVDFGLDVNQVAIDYNIQVEDEQNTNAPDESLIDSDDGIIYGLYVNEKFTPNEKVLIQAGLRYSVTGLTPENFISPRLSLNYQPNDILGFKFSVGRYQQLVHQVVEDNPFTNNQKFWALADNSGLPAIESFNWNAGFNVKKKGWLLDVEYFSKDVEGNVMLSISHLYNGQFSEPEETFSMGSNKITGVDVLLQKNASNYSGWVAYTYLMSNEESIFINNGAELPSLQDQRHEVKFVNMLDFKHFNFAATWIYGSGKPYLAPQINFIRDNTGEIQDFEIVNTLKTVQRLPVYNRFDLSAAYKFGSEHFSGEFGVSILNVLGRENIRGRRIDVGVLEQAIGQNERPRNIFRDLELLDFTPSFFFNIKF